SVFSLRITDRRHGVCAEDRNTALSTDRNAEVLQMNRLALEGLSSLELLFTEFEINVEAKRLASTGHEGGKEMPHDKKTTLLAVHLLLGVVPPVGLRVVLMVGRKPHDAVLGQ